MTSQNAEADCCDRAQELTDKIPPCTPNESEPGIGLCGWLLTMISWGLVMVTLPFSLFVCFKVVQEYERAVIFRLGRLLHGGSRGPGNGNIYNTLRLAMAKHGDPNSRIRRVPRIRVSYSFLSKYAMIFGPTKIQKTKSN